MDLLGEWGRANALAVLLMAPMAALVARLSRRPAWAHVAWLLVLLKLVTPPILTVPILGLWPEPRVAVVEPVAAPAPSLPIGREATLRAELRELMAEARSLAAPSARARPSPEISWPAILGLAWLTGSAAWLSLAGWRIARFALAMRGASPAPGALLARVEALSERIGLNRPPLVAFVPGRISPMVWSLGGRARLVVPGALWDRLDDAQRSALLVHELAHLKRGDPRVRLVELAATGLYWWHPALWWARRGLHRAEEACCDLWVVWALPESRKRYASALVEAVDFLSEDRVLALPAGASGMGQVEDLSRRIGMIMRSDAPRGLSRVGIMVTIALAAALLPWRPSWARQDPPKEESKPAVPAPADDAKPEPGPADDAKKPDDAIPASPDEAEPAIREKFRSLPEVARIREEGDQWLEMIGIVQRNASDPKADQAMIHIQGRLAELDVKYLDLWKKAYPKLKHEAEPKPDGSIREPADPAEVVARLNSELHEAPQPKKSPDDPTARDEENEAFRAEQRVEGFIQEGFLALPEVARLKEAMGNWEEKLAAAEKKVRHPEADPAVKGCRDRIAALDAEYVELWERMYPRLAREARRQGNEPVREQADLVELVALLRSNLHESLQSKKAPAEPAARDEKDEPAAGDGLKPEERDTTGASARLLSDLKKAEDRYAWSKQMFEKKYVTSSQVEADRFAVVVAKANIKDERRGHEQAIRQAQAVADLARSRLQVKKAGVQRAEAQRELARVEFARLQSLNKRGAGFVSDSEIKKAMAETAIAEAEVEQAKAEFAQEEVAVRLSEARIESVKLDAEAREANAVANPEPADPTRRIEELEAKMDRILKELETIRQEKAAKPGESKPEAH